LQTKRLWAVLISLFLPLTLAGAQSPVVLDRIVRAQELTVAQAAYLVFSASGRLGEGTEDEAFGQLKTKGWDGGRQPGAAERSDEFAWLLARAFPLHRGMLGTLFPGPRYAYRDLVFQGLLPAQGDPKATLSGAQGVGVLRKVLAALPEARP
jgi:hypothetical protein